MTDEQATMLKGIYESVINGKLVGSGGFKLIEVELPAMKGIKFTIDFDPVLVIVQSESWKDQYNRLGKHAWLRDVSNDILGRRYMFAFRSYEVAGGSNYVTYNIPEGGSLNNEINLKWSGRDFESSAYNSIRHAIIIGCDLS